MRVNWYGRIHDLIFSLFGLGPAAQTPKTADQAPGVATGPVSPGSMIAGAAAAAAAGQSILGVGAQVTPMFTATAPATGKMALIIRPPSGLLIVAGDWRHVKDRLGGAGSYRCASGRELRNAIAALWIKGTTQTWVARVQGPGDSWARVRFNGQIIGTARMDQAVAFDIPRPPLGIGFVTLEGATNQGAWVWAGEKVWYHYYRGAVLARPLSLPIPWRAGNVEITPSYSVRFGSVGNALEDWQQKALNALYKIAGASAYGQIMMKVQDWFAGFDPDRGLGKQTADRLSGLGFKKV